MSHFNRKRTSVLGLLALSALVAGHASLADTTIEIFSKTPTSGFQGGGLATGFEFSDFPNTTFLVEVNFKGVNGSGTTDGAPTFRYFMVSGRGIFNRGTTYEDSRQFPGIMNVDVDIVPVTALLSRTEGENGAHVENAVRILPIQIQRDVKLGMGLSAAVRLAGVVTDREVNIGKNLNAFAKFAVDLIGLRVVEEGMISRTLGHVGRETDGSTYLGFDLGAVKANMGVRWDLNEAVALRLSLNADVGSAVTAPVGSDNKGPVHLMATAEAFARFELLFALGLSKWSLFGDAGVRMIGSGAPTPSAADIGPVDHKVGDPYGFVQIGLRGTFQ